MRVRVTVDAAALADRVYADALVPGAPGGRPHVGTLTRGTGSPGWGVALVSAGPVASLVGWLVPPDYATRGEACAALASDLFDAGVRS